MKVDIISSIFGNKQVVEQCVESWHPVPKDWSVNLYNNKRSNEDGTTQMLLEKKKIHNFLMMSEEVDLKHADALNKLIASTSSDWILMLDSDAHLKDKNFYLWATKMMEKDRTLFWGTSKFYSPSARQCWQPPIPAYIMPRAESWIMLINRKFINDYSLDPNPIRIQGKITYGKIWHQTEKTLIDRKSPTSIGIAGDVGWQFYSAACQLGRYKNIPPEMLDCWKHVGHASCDPTRTL